MTGFELPWLPAGRIVTIEDRGEFFVRHHRHPDAARPTVLLLHGWTASADLQFVTAYEALAQHCSFVAIDHRGHGRGLRTAEVFRLEDAADDAAEVVRALGIDRVIVVGYSMGGPISLLVAQQHPGLVSGLVMQATALEWHATLRERLTWRLLPMLGVALRSWTSAHFMKRFLERMLAEHHLLARYVPWIRGEIQRADVDSIVQAGRALSRSDARPFASALGLPAAMLVTTRDRLVKPHKQRALAAALGAEAREIAADHLCPWETPDQFASTTVELVALVDASLRASGSSGAG